MYDSPAVYWDWAIGAYLFLGGLSGGAYVTGAVADYLHSRGTSSSARSVTARAGMLVSFLAIAAVGVVLLVFHLGQPLNAFELWRITNTDSWMAIGVWIITLHTAVVLTQLSWAVGGEAGVITRALGPIDHVARWFEQAPTRRLAVHVVGVPLAVVLITYTALLLGAAAPVVPLWHPTLLPALFLVGGLSIGISGTLLVTVLTSGTAGVTEFSLADDVLLIAELGVLAALLQYLATADGAARRSYEVLTETFVVEFWGMVVGVGILFPLVLSAGLVFIHRRGRTLDRRLDTTIYATKFGSVVIGGMFLRFSLLYAAMNVPILS